MEKIEDEKNQNIENNKSLIAYFNNFIKVDADEISDLSIETLFTLKQFLYEDYLSASQIVKILKETDFKAHYNHVQEKIGIFLKLDLMDKVNGDPLLKSNFRSTFYKLTSIGLFYLLKKMK